MYQKVKNGTKIYLKVTPNSAQNEVCGAIEGEFGQTMLRVKIAAVPDDGKANKALIKFLAKYWQIAPSDIEIISGETSRKKVILVKKDIDLPF